MHIRIGNVSEISLLRHEVCICRRVRRGIFRYLWCGEKKLNEKLN